MNISTIYSQKHKRLEQPLLQSMKGLITGKPSFLIGQGGIRILGEFIRALTDISIGSICAAYCWSILPTLSS
jgi:hypothetical protein